MTIGPYEFHPAAKMLMEKGGKKKIRLTDKEASILKYLFRAGDRPVARDVLLNEVWGYNAGVTTHTLETHIYRLRQKIERDPASAAILITDRGGYRLAALRAQPHLTAAKGGPCQIGERGVIFSGNRRVIAREGSAMSTQRDLRPARRDHRVEVRRRHRDPVQLGIRRRLGRRCWSSTTRARSSSGTPARGSTGRSSSIRRIRCSSRTRRCRSTAPTTGAR